MNDENIRTSLGKWSIAITLIPLIVFSILLLGLIGLTHADEGEGGLARGAIIGMVIFCAIHIIYITSLVGMGLAIKAIYKTHRQKGLIGLILNVMTLIITGACLLIFYLKFIFY
jgi:hypothetical protein